MADGVILNIQRFSIHDGPGIRTTVFFKGCPLSCSWCHNPESQRHQPEVMYWSSRCTHCGSCRLACPEQTVTLDGERWQNSHCTACGTCVAACPNGALELVGRRVSDSQVVAELLKDEAFYDQSGGGVTFSGGEPLAQPAFLHALLTGARRCHWHTAVDTSGFAPWSAIEPLVPLTSLWLYDLKLIDDATHRRFTGVPSQRILDNLVRLVSTGGSVEVRVPVIPGVNDTRENWEELQTFLRPLPIRGIKLLGYHQFGIPKYERLGLTYSLSELQSPSEERLAKLRQQLQTAGLPVV